MPALNASQVFPLNGLYSFPAMDMLMKGDVMGRGFRLPPPASQLLLVNGAP